MPRTLRRPASHFYLPTLAVLALCAVPALAEDTKGTPARTTRSPATAAPSPKAPVRAVRQAAPVKDVQRSRSRVETPANGGSGKAPVLRDPKRRQRTDRSSAKPTRAPAVRAPLSRESRDASVRKPARTRLPKAVGSDSLDSRTDQAADRLQRPGRDQAADRLQTLGRDRIVAPSLALPEAAGPGDLRRGAPELPGVEDDSESPSDLGGPGLPTNTASDRLAAPSLDGSDLKSGTTFPGGLGGLDGPGITDPTDDPTDSGGAGEEEGSPPSLGGGGSGADPRVMSGGGGDDRDNFDPAGKSKAQVQEAAYRQSVDRETYDDTKDMSDAEREEYLEDKAKEQELGLDDDTRTCPDGTEVGADDECPDPPPSGGCADSEKDKDGNCPSSSSDSSDGTTQTAGDGAARPTPEMTPEETWVLIQEDQDTLINPGSGEAGGMMPELDVKELRQQALGGGGDPTLIQTTGDETGVAPTVEAPDPDGGFTDPPEDEPIVGSGRGSKP